MKYIIDKANSAASRHYFSMNDANVQNDVKPYSSSTSAVLPNHKTIISMKKGYLPFPHLSKIAGETKVFHSLKHSLISPGQLCNYYACIINMNNHNLTVYKNKQKILQGLKSTNGDNLWNMYIPEPQNIPNKAQHPDNTLHQNKNNKKDVANIILQIDKKVSELAAFLYAACFSPTKTNFLDGIMQFFFSLDLDQHLL